MYFWWGMEMFGFKGGGGLGCRVLRLEKARGPSAAARSEKDREQSAAAKEGGGRYPILGKSH